MKYRYDRTIQMLWETERVEERKWKQINGANKCVHVTVGVFGEMQQLLTALSTQPHTGNNRYGCSTIVALYCF